MSVLVCYDGSPSARRALRTAAESLDGRSAVLMHVWTAPEHVLADAFGVIEDEENPDYVRLETLARRRADTVVEEGQALAAELGVEVTPRQERNHSSVWQTILDVADELDASLIVTGTHGRTAVQSDLLGSVSNALVHHSRRPVLVVPRPEGD